MDIQERLYRLATDRETLVEYLFDLGMICGIMKDDDNPLEFTNQQIEQLYKDIKSHITVLTNHFNMYLP